jgi:hypothetical protein
VSVAIAFLHFLANLIIALALLRVVQSKLTERLGPESPLVRALAFID